MHQKDKLFEEMNWHDNHVHGFALQEGKDGTGELLMDIDHITKWLCEDGGTFAFMIAPSTLTFHEVFNLKINVDYANPSMAIAPLSIHEIRRESFQYQNGCASYRWHIVLNSPIGEISFEAPGFSQRARGEAVKSKSQCLTPEVRSSSTFSASRHPGTCDMPLGSDASD
jgi:hypothetical protein